MSTSYAYNHIVPPRPGHRLHRSITEISPPTRKSQTTSSSNHRTNHHLQSPHHLITSARRARSSDKGRDTDNDPRSAHPNLQPFLAGEARWREGIRTEHGTPADSLNGSRRQSVFDIDGAGRRLESGSRIERRVVSEEELQAEKEKALLREKELRTSLVNLHAQSNDVSRRLDSTYYCVLEKVAALQSSILSLRELSSLAREVNDDFKTDSTALASESTLQLETFSNFTSQESRIQDLAQRVQAGRTKMTSLGERADAVKIRVESWERAEEAWQEKTRKRLRIMWIVISVFGGLLFGLVVFRYTPARNTGSGALHRFNMSELDGRVPGGENMTFSLSRGNEGGPSVLEQLQQGQLESDAEDPRIRALDEL